MPKRNKPLEANGQGAASSALVIRSRLPAWIIRVLREGGVKRMDVLSALSDEALLAIPGIGHRALALIRDELGRGSGYPGTHPVASVGPGMALNGNGR